jgi:hypothetical protein
MGLSQSPLFWSVNVGLAASIILILLLIFIEMTNPSFGNLGAKVSGLRGRYSLLTANLLLVFAGLVLTRIVMIIAG